LFGLAWGTFEFLTGQSAHLKYHSLPNVNRSAIYHLIALFTMCGIMLDNSGWFAVRYRISVGICLVVALAGLVVIGSRAGILAFLTGMSLLLISFLNNRRVRIIVTGGAAGLVLVIAGLAVYVDHPAVKERISRFTYYYHMVKEDSDIKSLVTPSDQVRYDYMRIAWAQISQKGNMLLGSGPGTYKSIDIEELALDPPLMAYKIYWNKLSHPHNEYLNRWVERGLVGLGVHILFLAYLAGCLWRNRSRSVRVHWQWVTILGFFNTALVAGFFNSVLTNETAWLGMMLTGIFLRWTRQQEAGREGSDA
jgi:O-antigen ligase